MVAMAMDVQNLGRLFLATLDPTQREAAEKELQSMRKIFTFGPLILQHITNPSADLPSRQAAAIYLKNYITHHWDDPTEIEIQRSTEKGEPAPFGIHEQDRAVLRDRVLEAVIDSPPVIRAQMQSALQCICKSDFPDKWPLIVQRIHFILASGQHELWLGSLTALYALVKAFEFRSGDERASLDEAIKFFQPVLLQQLQALLGDTSEASYSLIKMILKIFFCHVHQEFPQNVFTFEITEQWITVIRKILDSPVPKHVDDMDEDDRAETVWWKVKKWCLQIVAKIFDRYGIPKEVKKEYSAFAKFFVEKLAREVLQSVFMLLDRHIQGHYVSPRCMQQSLTYVRQALKVSSCWKLIKPHVHDLLARIVFPLMCFTEDDKDLWTDDPIEWLLSRADIQVEYISPESAAQYLLHTLCRKHPKLLPDILQYALNNLSPSNSVSMKEGALHFLGILGPILMKRKDFKDQVENILAAYGFPEMRSEHPFIRYRAVSFFRQLSYLEYKNKSNLFTGLENARLLLMEDNQLPVRVEAALCLNQVLDQQKAAEEFLQPHAIAILQVTLELLRVTMCEELSEVLQTFIVEFPEVVGTFAAEFARHLLNTFQNIVQKTRTEAGDDERTQVMTGMSVLQTLELLNDITSEKPAVNAQLAPVVIQVIQIILQADLVDFYEEMFGLLTSLTSKQIPPSLWEGFNICMQILYKPDYGMDYFCDMVVCLYNYVTRDPEAFLVVPERLKNLCTMCEHVLAHDDAGEDAQCHAAKLLEVVVLSYRGRIDQYIPAIMEVVFRKLFSSAMILTELKTQLLLVIVAALYYDPTSTLSMLQSARAPDGEEIIAKFLKMWLAEIDCMFGTHDRKMAVLGLTIFMQLPASLRNQTIQTMAPKLLPASLTLFQGLKRIYTHADSESDDEWTDDEGDEDVVNTDDEDANEPEMGQENGDDDEDSDSDWDPSEGYQSDTLKQLTTPLDNASVDEFSIFKQTVMNVQQHDPEWWNVLVLQANETDKNLLQEMLKFADERHAKSPEEPRAKQQ